SASISKGEPSVIKTSNISVEMPKVDSGRTSRVIIKDWVSDDEDTLVDTQVDSQTIVKPSFKKIEFTKAWNESVKSDKQADKPKMVTQNSKADRKDFKVHNTRILKETVNTVRINGVNTVGQTSVSTVEGNEVIAVKTSVGIGKIKTNKIDFEDVFFMKELKFNLFFVLQMRDKKNSVLFTESEYLVLSPGFKLIDESQVLLRVPRQNNMYNFDLKNVVSSGDLTCLFSKATIDESNLWHRRLGHVNFKTMNKLVKGNLVRGLLSNTFKNDHTFVACQKGKQHKASLTDDFSRFSWVFFLATKSETSGILKKFITEIENQLNKKVKVIRVLVTMPHNKTPYELIIGRPPSISFMRPFECPVTILNTLDPLGKFDGKAKEGFLIGYSVNSKAFRKNVDVGHTKQEKVSTQQYIVFPLWSTISLSYKSSDDKARDNTADDVVGKEKVQEPVSEYDQDLKNVLEMMMNQEKKALEQSDDITQALNDKSWVEAMLEELLQFKIQKVWTLVDLPCEKKAIGAKWVYQNKKDERGIVVRNKARLVAQGHKQEEDIDYDEVFAPVARVKAIKLFLAFALYMNFPVYQMDVKSAFLYGTIEEEVYVNKPLGFVDPEFLKKVYKVEKALYGLHQAPRA
nr:retrovirus-related Pol polyprotein from transposon TNT 1-94 [Tanacetum cinerariifolium]